MTDTLSDKTDHGDAPWDGPGWPRGLFTLPPTQPFLPTLAQTLFEQCRDDPMALADITILLPTRRACRVLRQAFLDAPDRARPEPGADDDAPKAGTALLLPILRPIGDVDEDELLLTDADPGLEPLPSPIGALDRQLRLARAIMAAAPKGEKPSPDMAIDLAAELARLLDQLHTEGVSFELLHDLVPDDFAEHWQEVLQFLDILGAHWPAVLEELQALDPAKYRELWLLRAADRLRRDRPSAPVIIAGSTGSIPATAALMRTVLDLPQGAVILPGYDAVTAAQAQTESHAQFQMQQLLTRLDVAPEQVAEWPKPWPDGPFSPSEADARLRLITSLTEGPLGLAEDGLETPGLQLDPAMVKGVIPISCAGPEQEALVAALAMREVLDPSSAAQTAMLVTPDRDMARRVAIMLRRYGIVVNDSAGVPLSNTPVGQWLRLTAIMLTDRWGARDLLACFKHPYAALRRNPAACRDAIRLVEQTLLRGPRVGGGAQGLLDALDHVETLDEAARVERGAIVACRQFLTDLQSALTAVDGAGDDAAPVPSLVNRHIRFAEALATSVQAVGANRLWRGDDGEAAAAFLSELAAVGGGFPPMGWAHYGDFITGLMAGRVVRPQRQAHPRLTILGLLEARLVEADRVIMAGLNEGSWPPEPTADPWLSRPMRRKLGLPTPERRLGQTAHDFAQLLGAPEVFLLRAERQGGAPTIPARWMQFLDVALAYWKQAGFIDREGPVNDMQRRAEEYKAWARVLDQAGMTEPRPAPQPSPASALRPDRLSVTDIELLIRNPYGFYAKHVLALRPLDDLELDPGASDRGAFIHTALERFCQRYPDRLPADGVAQLLAIGEEVFQVVADRPDIHTFWWSRFQRIASWFVTTEAERRAVGWRPHRLETKGRVTITTSVGPVTLTGRADRLDRHAHDKALAIIDYKTGGVPSAQEVRQGIAPQLALEAMIAAAGQFENVPEQIPGELAYWQLTGGREPGKIASYQAAEVEALTTHAEAGVVALLHAFASAERPYLPVPRPSLAPRYDDYAHLARYDEWAPGLRESAS